MVLRAPVLEQTYRYPFPSSLVGDGDRRRLRLATSGGPAPHPRLFRGRLLLPVVAADLLLTLGDVARSRFHVPAQMLKRILELADPVATSADDRLRFEAFSACCSVYGRVDLLPGAFDGEILGRGTTNVDFGPGIRTALAGIQERSELGLSIGASELEVKTEYQEVSWADSTVGETTTRFAPRVLAAFTVPSATVSTVNPSSCKRVTSGVSNGPAVAPSVTSSTFGHTGFAAASCRPMPRVGSPAVIDTAARRATRGRRSRPLRTGRLVRWQRTRRPDGILWLCFGCIVVTPLAKRSALKRGASQARGTS